VLGYTEVERRGQKLIVEVESGQADHRLGKQCVTGTSQREL